MCVCVPVLGGGTVVCVWGGRELYNSFSLDHMLDPQSSGAYPQGNELQACSVPSMGNAATSHMTHPIPLSQRQTVTIPVGE